jgi:cytochrome P450
MTHRDELPELPMPNVRECPFGPPAEYARLRAEAPVTKVVCPTGVTAWLVTGYDDAREVLGDTERFSTRPGQASHVLSYMKPDDPVEEGQFARMDGEEHRRFRRHLGPEVSTMRYIDALRPRVRRIVDERLDALAGRTPPVDLYAEFAKPVTTLVIAELIGVPYADREVFQRSAAAVFDVTTTKEDLEKALTPLYEYLYGLIVTRRDKPEDDALSRMILQSNRTERPFTDLELLMMAGALLVAGSDTTAVTISYGVLMLLEHPDELARLRANPALAGTAAEEIVRHLAAGAGLLRGVVRDTKIGGRPVAAGDLVVVAVQSANRDPGLCPDPDRLDVGRSTSAHLGFGHGPHHCVGRQLARLEIETVLAVLPRRIPSLRLAIPLEEVPFKPSNTPVGPAALPMAWDAVLPAGE